MPTLHLDDVPAEVYEPLQRLAATHNRTVEAEVLNLLRQTLSAPRPADPRPKSSRTSARSFRPAPGEPDSVELLREDRAR